MAIAVVAFSATDDDEDDDAAKAGLVRESQ